MLSWKRKSSKPEIVPERLKATVNYKVLILIAGIVISFQAYLYYAFPKPDDASKLVDVISVINPSIAASFGFYVAKKYRGTEVFGKAYLALAIALALNAVGETVYGVYDVLGLDTTFTVADIIFYSFYPMVLVHLILNIRFFKPKISKLTKIWVPLVPTIIILTYIMLSIQKATNFDFNFYTGLTYVVLSSVTLAGTMLGARIFRQGVLGIAWLILLIGVILQTTGDVWYSYLDAFGDYTLVHPVNLCWYASYMVIAYALFKHQKTV